MIRKSNSDILTESKCFYEIDLFEEIKCDLRCEYISDIRYEPFLSLAKNIMKHKKFDKYPLSMLSDIAEYLYGNKVVFHRLDEAVSFFGGNNPKYYYE